MRITRVLPWLILIGIVVFSAAVYSGLPTELPRTVDFNGRVTGTAGKSLWTWALLPIIAVAAQLLIEGIRRALPSRPELFNFPGKDDLLKLPREYHPPVIAQMQWFLDVIASATNAIMFGVQILMWYTARGGSSQNASLALMMISVLFTPLIFLLVQRVSNEVESAKRKWESRRNPLAG